MPLGAAEETAYSSDGLWVWIKVEWEGEKPPVSGVESGGSKRFAEKIPAKFTVTVKGRNDADPKVITALVRDFMGAAMGRPPVAMPASYAGGLIIFQWEGKSELSEDALLQSLSAMFHESKIGKGSAQEGSGQEKCNTCGETREDILRRRSGHYAPDFQDELFRKCASCDRTFCPSHIWGHGCRDPYGWKSKKPTMPSPPSISTMPFSTRERQPHELFQVRSTYDGRIRYRCVKGDGEWDTAEESKQTSCRG